MADSSGLATTSASSSSPNAVAEVPTPATSRSSLGRPPLSEAQKLRRATAVARGAYELAMKAFNKKREQLVDSAAWWDHPSVVARLTHRMKRRAERVEALYAVPDTEV